MKRTLLITLIIILSVSVFAQKTAEKTLVKPINLQGKEMVDIYLAGNVDVKEWANNYVQVEINVQAYGINSQVLKSLVSAGRYNVKIDTESEKIILSSPNLEKALKVRGKALKDEVEYTLYVPSTVVVYLKREEGLTSN